jgi:acyl-lipid omega-6 desaturase (Delta-12 desaturase)
MSSSQAEPNWRQLVAPYKKASTARALFQLANTVLPLVAIWAVMVWTLEVSYALTLLLAVPAAFLIVRLFIFQHDCGHGSFFPSNRANHFLGRILGVITLVPYAYWRRTHAIHHATSSNLDAREFGDIYTRTVQEYLALTPKQRFWYRVYRHPLILFVIGPTYQFVLKHRLPLDVPKEWRREWQSVMGTNVSLVVLFGALIWGLGWKTVFAVHAPIVVLACSIGVWLFYVQHQFEDNYWEHQDAWDFYRAGVEGSSFYDLHTIGHWLTGNIGYHHIHHLASAVPNYRLPACFRENPEFQRVTRLTFRESLSCIGFKLWDEERRTMVGFGHEAVVQATAGNVGATA